MAYDGMNLVVGEYPIGDVVFGEKTGLEGTRQVVNPADLEAIAAAAACFAHSSPGRPPGAGVSSTAYGGSGPRAATARFVNPWRFLLPPLPSGSPLVRLWAARRLGGFKAEFGREPS